MSRRRRKKKKGTGMVLFLSVVILAGGVTLFSLTNETFAAKLKSMTTDKVKEQEIRRRRIRQRRSLRVLTKRTGRKQKR